LFEDWNEVYGSVPQDLINIEKDAIKSMIESKIELAGAFQTQENAYKQYLKSRPLASTQSVRAAKNIRLVHSALPIHPIFSKSQI
jgi:ATP-dependent RNA helicase DDX54/DBP10